MLVELRQTSDGENLTTLWARALSFNNAFSVVWTYFKLSMDYFMQFYVGSQSISIGSGLYDFCCFVWCEASQGSNDPESCKCWCECWRARLWSVPLRCELRWFLVQLQLHSGHWTVQRYKGVFMSGWVQISRYLQL